MRRNVLAACLALLPAGLLVTIAMTTTAQHDVTWSSRPTAWAACWDPALADARPDPDLYCIELVHAPAFSGATGVAELVPGASPFGVAVSADGHHVYDLVVTLDGLPDPATIGPYGGYVAWATTPLLRPMQKLGEVGNGRTEVGPVGFDKFLILVTAEESAAVEEQAGRIVLRGVSPSMRMMPHEIPYLLAGGVWDQGGHAGHGEPRPAAPAGDPAAVADARDRPGDHPGGRTGQARHREGGGHADHGDHAADAEHAGLAAEAPDWVVPPMHPQVPMPPELGIMELRPGVTPFVPGLGAGGTIPEARPAEVVRLADGDTIELEAGLVRRTVGNRTFTMYGFNGQYPGPMIEVDEGSTVVVDFTNRTELPTAVHWHGVRLDNRFDGVPHVTQDPVPPGGSFRYEVHFRDAGIYWYHPHHREDIQQDLGLYGNMLVHSPDPEFYSPVNREEVLILDDLLVAGDALVPHGLEAPTHALMGRFGNLLLVNGEPGSGLDVLRGEVVRFYLTNAANTRTFNVSFGGSPIKLVGSDLGKFEREEWVESVVLAPAERYIVEVRFDEPGDVVLANRVRAIDHLYGNFFPEVDTLVTVRVASEPVTADDDFGEAFARLRENADMSADIGRYREHFDRPVDHTLVLTQEVGELPFPLGPLMRLDSAYFHPVEWSGTMPDMDWLVTGREAEWILRDPVTGAENMDIDWRFRVGDVVRIRLVNERRVLHAMQHPIHLHGQRFLILARNGVPNDNMVWKDTILLPVGATADILLEITNPGRWMLHCHIAEHLEAGMHMVFTVDEAVGKAPP